MENIEPIDEYSECEECAEPITVEEWIKFYGHCEECYEELSDEWDD